MAPGIGDTLRRLFGSGGGQAAAAPAAEPVTYKGYTIRPAPQREGRQWLTAGTISKTIGGVDKEHHYVRGDLYADHKSAVEFSLYKGQQIVDLEGDRIFD